MCKGNSDSDLFPFQANLQKRFYNIFIVNEVNNITNVPFGTVGRQSVDTFFGGNYFYEINCLKSFCSIFE